MANIQSTRLNQKGRGRSLPLHPRARVAYAAAHVVIDPLKPDVLDMEATLAFRRHLWSLGFGVAEAMDTAQRGMGLSWQAARELIRVSAGERAGEIACGANTDQLEIGTAITVDDVIAAYEEQCETIEAAGGRSHPHGQSRAGQMREES